MVRIAIVEDDNFYVEQLGEYLEKYQTEEREEFDITVYLDGDEITAKYKAQFDIILMDIQMKFVDGMTAAEEIRSVDSQVIIIFITNMSQYAIRGYEVNALDYVVKPVSYFSFSQKLKKALDRMKSHSGSHIVIPVRGGIKRIQVADIYYIESEGHNLIYHTKDNDIISPSTIKVAEELLKDVNFSRGNKGYLINLEHVEGIEDKCAVVKGNKLLISRPRMRNFMQDLTRYWGGQ